jgi:D-glycero-alpha-D-manno-heptose-7-phosphate kinase
MMEFGADGDVVVNPLRLQPAIVQELEASLVLYYTGISRQSADIIERQASHIRSRDAARLQATHDLKVEAVTMKEAVLKGDLSTLAAVLNQGWAAKSRLADGISTRNIEEIFSTALASGALAGKVSGAGGGGYLILLCEPTERPTLLAALAELPTGRVEALHFVAEGAVAWTVR